MSFTKSEILNFLSHKDMTNYTFLKSGIDSVQNAIEK